MDDLDLLRITPCSPVDPLIHAESCPPGRDTECHPQSHVVHMHNRYVPAAVDGYPQYPQGLLTLLTPFFLFIQITSPLLPRAAKIDRMTLNWAIPLGEFCARTTDRFQLKLAYSRIPCLDAVPLGCSCISLSYPGAFFRHFSPGLSDRRPRDELPGMTRLPLPALFMSH